MFIRSTLILLLFAGTASATEVTRSLTYVSPYRIQPIPDSPADCYSDSELLKMSDDAVEDLDWGHPELPSQFVDVSEATFEFRGCSDPEGLLQAAGFTVLRKPIWWFDR